MILRSGQLRLPHVHVRARDPYIDVHTQLHRSREQSLGKVLIEEVPIFQALDESPDIHASIVSCQLECIQAKMFGSKY